MPLKLTRRHGSPCWYIRGSIRGVRVDESTGLSCRKAAEEVLARRATEILDRSIHGDAVSRTFAEAALAYYEGGGEELLPAVLRYFNDTPIGSIGQAELELAAKKLFPGRAPATINRRLYTPTVAVLNHAARLKWCSRPIIARPKAPAPRNRWIRHDDADRLIESAAPHLRPLVVFLLCTGARLSEALYLDWSDVSLERRHVLIRPTDMRRLKNDASERGVPLHSRAVAALSTLPYRRGAVFLTQRGLPYASRDGEGGGQVKTAWAGMCRRAGIADFTPHDCRHTWATWHYMANRDVTALMALGGWKTLDMVVRYSHVNADHLKPGQDLIWGKDGDEPIRLAVSGDE